MYVAHYLILLRLNPFDLRVYRESWWYEHSVSRCRFDYQQRVLETFPGCGYLSSEDGVVWLWYLLWCFILYVYVLYIYMHIYMYIYIYAHIYIYYIFSTHNWKIFEVAIESWPKEWDLNPRPLNSVQTL